jgi:hypothetical protein
MAQQDNILKELQELNSGLSTIGRQNVFAAPAGYFDNFAGIIINRIKALEAVNGTEELALLSPLLSQVSKRNPYTVPAGYFDGLEKKLEDIILTEGQNAAEELESLSPLLSSLKNKSTYTIPEGYFEKLPAVKENTVTGTKTKVVSITNRKWFRYAAAAMVIGIVATIGLILLNKEKNIDPSEKSFAWIQKNMKKVSTDDINEFVELASAGSADMVKVETKEEISNLLKDVSDKEIQDFLNDTQSAESETEDELILN